MSDVLTGLGVETASNADPLMDDLLSVDDSLSIAEKWEKYVVQSDQILHHLYVIREFGEYVKKLGMEETKSFLVPIMFRLKDDSEPVIRQALVEQMVDIGTYIMKEDPRDEQGLLKTCVFPIVSDLVMDKNAQVRLSGMEAMIHIASPANIQILLGQVLAVIHLLAGERADEEFRVEAVRIIHHMAGLVGADVCVSELLPLVRAFARDTFRVRKALASYLGNVCRVLGPERSLEHLWSLYSTLCEDEIWGVRRACVESVVAVAEVLGPAEANARLTPAFVKFLEDGSRWVRSVAYMYLGRFIAVLSGPDVTGQLLTYYNEMITVNRALHGDSEIVYFCAFNFPGVLATIGPARWGEISATFATLACDLQWQVRQPLAHALHEIAAVLGQEVTVSQLVPTFNAFLKDIDDVKIGAVRHFADFLACLPEAQRPQYVSDIREVCHDSNWRMRKIMARQLGRMASLYPPKAAAEFLVPLVLSLAHDAVAAVRGALYGSMAALYHVLLLAKSPELDKFRSELCDFFTASSYVDRQTYAYLLLHLLDRLDPVLFQQNFLPQLIVLSSDKVPNVRMIAATCVHTLAKKEPYSSLESIHEIQRKLAEDKDRDVAYKFCT